MDLMLIFIMLMSYVLLIYLGIPIWWSLLVSAFIGLLYLGLRYPRGKEDWRFSFKETLYIVMTLFTMYIFIMAIQAALQSIGGDLPPAVQLLVFFIVVPAMSILFLLGLFFPHGRSFIPKKTEKTGE